MLVDRSVGVVVFVLAQRGAQGQLETRGADGQIFRIVLPKITQRERNGVASAVSTRPNPARVCLAPWDRAPIVMIVGMLQQGVPPGYLEKSPGAAGQRPFFAGLRHREAQGKAL